MKTNFVSRLMPSSMARKNALRQLAKREIKLAERVVIDANLDSADKKLIQEKQITLAKYAKRNNVYLQFAPQSSDMFSNTTLTVCTRELEREAGKLVEKGNNTYERLPSTTYIQQYKIGSRAVDNTMSSQEQLNNIKTAIKDVIHQHKINPAKQVKDYVVKTFFGPPM